MTASSTSEIIQPENQLKHLFNRFDCQSECESLNNIPGANNANKKIVSRNKIGKSDTQDKNKYNSSFIDGKQIKELIAVQKGNFSRWGLYYQRYKKAGRYPIGKIDLLCDTFLVRRLTA